MGSKRTARNGLGRHCSTSAAGLFLAVATLGHGAVAQDAAGAVDARPQPFSVAQLSAPAPGGPVAPNSPAVPQQLQPSSPATEGLGLPPTPLSPRISLRTDQLPYEVGKGPKLGRYYLNRAEEDFSYLRNPSKSNDVFDPLKFVPLNKGGSIYLTFSGEARLRNETYTKNSFSYVPPEHQDVLLLRERIGADLHVGEHVRGFAELESGQEGGSNYGSPAGVNRNDLQLQQAFVEVTGNVGGLQTGVRAGRQELVFGSALIFSTREPTNIQYSHDGVRAYFDDQTTRVDALAFDTVINRNGVLQDSTNTHQQFWGFYGSQVLPVFQVFGQQARVFVDPFYVGYQNRSVTFDTGIVRLTYHATGCRFLSSTRKSRHGRQVRYWQPHLP